MGLNGTILTLGGWDSSFFFFGGAVQKAKINNKKEKYLDKQGKILLQ